MLLAKKEWFQRRKYGWWWVTPRKLEWWIYIFAMIWILTLLQVFEFWTDLQRIYITLWWLMLLAIDIIPIMFTLEKDEREHKIEAISERNAAWMMSFVLTIWIVYETILSWLNGEVEVNIFLIIALISWVIIKSISNYILEKKWE